MDVQVKVVMPERSLNSMSLTCGLVFRRGRTRLVVVALELLLLGQDDLRRLEGFDGRAVQALGLANQLQQLHVEVDVQLPVWCARGARWTRWPRWWCPSPSLAPGGEGEEGRMAEKTILRKRIQAQKIGVLNRVHAR